MAFTYQWTLDGVPIPGATGATHTLVISDYGHTLSCSVTDTNDFGSATAVSRNPIALPQAYPVNTVAPAITGTARVGQVLTVSNNGTWTGLSTITYTYVWRRNGVDISGAISNTYTLVAGDLGANITCNVRAANKYGWGEAISNSKGPIIL